MSDKLAWASIILALCAFAAVAYMLARPKKGCPGDCNEDDNG